MKTRIIMVSFMLLMTLALLLGACNIPVQPNTGMVETAAAQTVSARLTQMAFETLAARATELAQPTSTQGATQVPSAVPSATATTVLPTATTILPTATATAVPLPCNLASFVTDVTIKDGQKIYAGEAFTKTWRVKNIGSCVWTTDYDLVFVSGKSMSAPASVAMPGTVKYGQSIDISVNMVAPTTAGEYEGYWMLRDGSGNQFGVGATGKVALSVEIVSVKVPTSKDEYIVYDFAKNYCAATWKTQNGNIGCPSAGYDFKNGSITRTYKPALENNTIDDEGTIITIPAGGSDGVITGAFPAITIKPDYKFRAVIGCMDDNPKCTVIFEVLYKVAGESVKSFGTQEEKSDGKLHNVDIALAALEGQKVTIYLRVKNMGGSTNDAAFWLAPRITTAP